MLSVSLLIFLKLSFGNMFKRKYGFFCKSDRVENL